MVVLVVVLFVDDEPDFFDDFVVVDECDALPVVPAPARGGSRAGPVRAAAGRVACRRRRTEGDDTMDEALRERREAVVREHFASESAQEFDRTLATFNGHPHYEIMATGQVFDGADEVMGYYRTTRTAFPDQRHDDVRLHFADDAVIAEFDLLGTNLGEFYGRPPTGQAFRVPISAVFFFEADEIVNERIYFDSASLLRQIGHGDLLAS